jgi:hypothetical protein
MISTVLIRRIGGNQAYPRNGAGDSSRPTPSSRAAAIPHGRRLASPSSRLARLRSAGIKATTFGTDFQTSAPESTDARGFYLAVEPEVSL